MVASMQIRADGLSRVEKRLGEIAAHITDMSELMDRFGLYLEASTIDRFDDEAAPDGTPWVPSARALAEGGKTLTDTGLLRGSITYVASRNQVEWGSNLVYARRHQEGFSGQEEVSAHQRTIRQAFGRTLPGPVVANIGAFTRQANTPARPFLGVSAADEEQLLGLADDYLLEALGGDA